MLSSSVCSGVVKAVVAADEADEEDDEEDADDGTEDDGGGGLLSSCSADGHSLSEMEKSVLVDDENLPRNACACAGSCCFSSADSSVAEEHRPGVDMGRMRGTATYAPS